MHDDVCPNAMSLFLRTVSLDKMPRARGAQGGLILQRTLEVRLGRSLSLMVILGLPVRCRRSWQHTPDCRKRKGNFSTIPFYNY